MFIIMAWLLAGLRPMAAATTPELTLVGPAGLIRTGEQLVVELQLDSAGRQINAAELHLNYPPENLQLVRIGRELSAFNQWPEEPKWDAMAGTVTIIGGRPGGLIAHQAVLATLYFEVRQSGSASVQLRDSQIFLHDGRGTAADLPSATLELTPADPLIGGLVLRSTTHPTLDSWSRDGKIEVSWDLESGTLFSYLLSPDRLAGPDELPEQAADRASYANLADGVYYFSMRVRDDQDWSAVSQRRFLLDATPPEPFTIQTIIVDNRSLLSWSTTDAMSGVAVYRLLLDGRDRGPITNPWPVSQKWRGHGVSIMAVDAAGNKQVTPLTLARSRLPFGELGAILLALLIGWWLLYLNRRRPKNHS